MNRVEQLVLRKDILKFNPKLFYPWYWFAPCEVKVLLVVDGLDFGVNGFGLSTFTTIFKTLEIESPVHINYKVTLAHRFNPGINSQAMQGGNPDIDNRIVNFRFDNNSHFTDTKYDQVWLFGISTSYNLSVNEVNAVESYMNKGGGLFATGDHGALGRSLCGNIPRVKDMRHWMDTNPNQNLNEVSMGQRRRNDTNQPQLGNTSSTVFNDQSDDIPQNIHAKMYGGLPHPLLSIKTSLSPSGIIHYMPDHPHEGECKPETDFVVTNPKTGLNHTIRTQNIATSFVLSGNTSGSKDPTDPHCFPSIGIFDGRSANVGRIVIDSTWHHFVNINIQGFTPNNYEIIETYYKNISKWMSRKKFMLCLFKRYIIHAMFSERIMEASMLNPEIQLEKIPLSELYAIGRHAIDVVSEDLNPADGLQFALTNLEELIPDLVEKLDPWRADRDNQADNPINQWINPEALLSISIGTGIVAIRDEFEGQINEPITEDMESKIDKVFVEGTKMGIDKAFKSLETNLSLWSDLSNRIVEEDHSVNGVVIDNKGNPVGGLIIKAVDLDFTGVNNLGSEVITDKEGKFVINYKQTDFVIKGKESGGADIVLYVMNKDRKLILKTELYANSPKKTKIDIKLK